MGTERTDTQEMSLTSALQQLAVNPLQVLAGGTDYFPALGESAVPDYLLDLTKVAELRGIRITDDVITIGATTTWTDIINAELPAYFKGLKEAAREVGSVQIQNAGTIAGNLCNASPAADGVPPLLALNASIELASIDGSRCVPLSEFITGPRSTELASDELVVAIHIPNLAPDARSGFYKLGSRRYLVISIVMASVTLLANDTGELQDVRIAVGACSAVAKRMSALEKILTGQSIHSDLESLVKPQYFQDLTPISDVRASALYRENAAYEVVVRLLRSTLATLPQRGISTGTRSEAGGAT